MYAVIDEIVYQNRLRIYFLIKMDIEYKGPKLSNENRKFKGN